MDEGIRLSLGVNIMPETACIPLPKSNEQVAFLTKSSILVLTQPQSMWHGGHVDVTHQWPRNGPTCFFTPGILMFTLPLALNAGLSHNTVSAPKSGPSFFCKGTLLLVKSCRRREATVATCGPTSFVDLAHRFSTSSWSWAQTWLRRMASTT